MSYGAMRIALIPLIQPLDAIVKNEVKIFMLFEGLMHEAHRKVNKGKGVGSLLIHIALDTF